MALYSAHTDVFMMPAAAGLKAWFAAEARTSVDAALINGQPRGI